MLPAGVFDGKPRANGCRQRLGNRVGLACARLDRGLVDSAFFDARHPVWHTNHAGWPAKESDSATYFVEKIPQHGLGHFVVRDHAVAQRANDFDVLRMAAKHIACFLADGDDAFIFDGQGDHRWFL
jgi:hypothetical protein